jgi:NAD(P)-dependent dehydrogenase (short-subunit alcohol dehydrogenase family)
MKVAGKSVVVTGGASGIGRALAERFAAEGARGVVVADINTEWAKKVAERIGERGFGVGCDVSDPDAINRLVSTAQGSFGPIDVFCSNAGFTDPAPGDLMFGRPPGDESAAPPDGGALGEVLMPEDVAGTVIEAMDAERFLILPHPQVGESFLRKATDYDAWLSRTRARLRKMR